MNKVTYKAAKTEAFKFLSDLEQFLRQNLPHRSVLRDVIDTRWSVPTISKPSNDKIACKENILLYHFVLPAVSKHLQETFMLTEVEVASAIRGEYYQKFPHLLSKNVHRAQGHPFNKNPWRTSGEIYAGWTAPIKTTPLNQAYPDFSFVSPLPHRVVGDIKYFTKESFKAAETSLVESIYEVFYYRGLSRGIRNNKSGANWHYDYGFLLMFDASEGGHLEEAFRRISSPQMFWDDASIYVAIIR